MLVWRLNLAWKSGHPNQCLRLGDDAKTDRTLGARFREGASHSNPLSEGAAFEHLLTPSSRVSLKSTVGYHRENGTRRGSELFKFHYDIGPVAQRLEQGTHNLKIALANKCLARYNNDYWRTRKTHKDVENVTNRQRRGQGIVEPNALGSPMQSIAISTEHLFPLRGASDCIHCRHSDPLCEEPRKGEFRQLCTFAFKQGRMFA